jgi:hypothetical protein
VKEVFVREEGRIELNRRGKKRLEVTDGESHDTRRGGGGMRMKRRKS